MSATRSPGPALNLPAATQAAATQPAATQPAATLAAVAPNDLPRPAGGALSRRVRPTPIGGQIWLRIGFCAQSLLVLLAFVITLHLPFLFRNPGGLASIQQQAADLLDAVERAEASARNFLLTDDPNALETYASVGTELPALRTRMAGTVPADAQQAHRIADLGPMIDSLMADLARSVSLVRGGNREAALQLAASAHFRSISDRIGDLVHHIEDSANQDRKDRHDEETLERESLMVLLGLSLLLGIAMFVGHRLVTNRAARAASTALAAAESRAEARLRRLRDNEALLRIVTENARVGLSIIGADYRYRFINRAYADLLNRREIPPPGTPISDILPTVYDSQVRPRIERALAGERMSYELVMPPSGQERGERRFLVNLEPGADATGLPIAIAVVTEVTQRAAAMRALLDSKTRFRSLFDLSPTGTLLLETRDESRVVDCNKAAAATLGYTPAEMLGLALRDIDAEMPASRLRAMAAESAAGLSHLFETRHRTKTGELRDVLIASVPLRLGTRDLVHCTVIDITGHKAAETALTGQLRSILHTVPDALVVAGEDGRIVDFGAAAERIFGWRADEVVGANICRLLPDAGEPGHVESFAAWLATASMPGDGSPRTLVGRRKCGETFPMELVMGEARGSDGRRLYTGFMRDLSQRERIAKRLRDLQDELAHVSRLAAMGTMATTLAHELNQPLTAIANFAAAARRLLAGTPDAAALAAGRESLDEASAEAIRAGRIVRQLREFLGTGSTERTREHPGSIIEEAAGLALGSAGEMGLTVKFMIDPNLPLVRVDRIQVQQVVVNLIRNAVESMAVSPPPHSSRHELEIQVTRDPPHIVKGDVTVMIADTGLGLSDEGAERLFEPFVTSKRDGMGLGLSISRDIVVSHGGTLTAHSRPEGGMLFRFTLPADPIDEESLTDAA